MICVLLSMLTSALASTHTHIRHDDAGSAYHRLDESIRKNLPR